MRAVFGTLFEEKLMAYANAQKRFSGGGLLDDDFIQITQSVHCVTKGGDSGKDDSFGHADQIRVGSEDCFNADVAKGVTNALDVAYVVIYDCDHIKVGSCNEKNTISEVRD